MAIILSMILFPSSRMPECMYSFVAHTRAPSIVRAVSSASASASLSTPATEKPDERLQSLEELISTCRDARRRAEGLLDGSAAKARSPLGDVSNGVATARNASETVEPKRALTFGVERAPGQP